MRFTAKGIVWGNCWGGGKCGFASKVVSGQSYDEIKKTANNMLKDGSLDNGMGFESLYAATLSVKVENTKIIDDKEYINTSYDTLFIGTPSDKEIDCFYETI